MENCSNYNTNIVWRPFLPIIWIINPEVLILTQARKESSHQGLAKSEGFLLFKNPAQCYRPVTQQDSFSKTQLEPGHPHKPSFTGRWVTLQQTELCHFSSDCPQNQSPSKFLTIMIKISFNHWFRITLIFPQAVWTPKEDQPAFLYLTPSNHRTNLEVKN